MRSHRRNISSFPTVASQKQGSRENVGREQTLLTSGDRKLLPQKRPAQEKEQKAKTAISLLCDLEQVTNSLCLHFFPICQMEIIKAVLKLE